MRDHCHVIVKFDQPGQLSKFVQQLKRESSRLIQSWYQRNDIEYVKSAAMTDRVWTPKYYSYEIYAETKLREKLTYMHMNPVRAGLVDNSIDWKWSSARWYESRRSVGVPISWVG